MTVQLRLEGYQGNLSDLVHRLKRRSLDVGTICASDLVAQLQEGWKLAPTLESVADDLPVAAWVIHRKGLGLLPQEPEMAEPEGDGGESVRWVKEASLGLRHRWATIAHPISGPARWPDPLEPRLIEATPWRLRMAWPPGRIRKSPPAPVVILAPRALWRRGLEAVRRIRRYGGRCRWEDLVQGLSREDTVETFMVMLSLWARHRLILRQDAPLSSLEVAINTRRSDS